MIFSLLSSCNVTAPGTLEQPNQINTVPPNQLSLSPAAIQKVAQINWNSEWQVYDINAITWSPDSSRFILAGEENDDGKFGIYAYSINASKELWYQKLYGVPFTLTFVPNNQTIFVPLLGGGTFFLDPATGQVIREIDYNVGSPCFGAYGAIFSPDGKKILTLASDLRESTEIYIWDLASNRCLGTFLKEPGVSFGFESSRDGQFLVLALRDIPFRTTHESYIQFDQQIQMWNVETQQKICSFKGIEPVAFTSDGNTIAATNVNNSGEVDLWNAKSCRLIDVIRMKAQDASHSLAFSPDGQLLAIGGDNMFQIWQVAGKKLLVESDKLPNKVNILAFSPDGHFLLSETNRVFGTDKGIITLWGVRQ
jgi:WD40 repeat protein